MNHMFKIYLTNKFLLVLLSSFLFSQPRFSQWLDKNKSLIESDYKSITFIYNNFSNNQNTYQDVIQKCKLTLGLDNKFRFENENKIIISNGTDWRSYDIRTNQIFIYDIDMNIEKIISDLNNFSKLKKNILSRMIFMNKEYHFDTPYLKQPFLINISEDGILESIIVKNNFKLSQIKIYKEDSLNLSINKKNIMEFDLRKK